MGIVGGQPYGEATNRSLEIFDRILGLTEILAAFEDYAE